MTDAVISPTNKPSAPEGQTPKAPGMLASLKAQWNQDWEQFKDGWERSKNSEGSIEYACNAAAYLAPIPSGVLMVSFIGRGDVQSLGAAELNITTGLGCMAASSLLAMLLVRIHNAVKIYDYGQDTWFKLAAVASVALPIALVFAPLESSVEVAPKQEMVTRIADKVLADVPYKDIPKPILTSVQYLSEYEANVILDYLITENYRIRPMGAEDPADGTKTLTVKAFEEAMNQPWR